MFPSPVCVWEGEHVCFPKWACFSLLNTSTIFNLDPHPICRQRPSRRGQPLRALWGASPSTWASCLGTFSCTGLLINSDPAPRPQLQLRVQMKGLLRAREPPASCRGVSLSFPCNVQPTSSREVGVLYFGHVRGTSSVKCCILYLRSWRVSIHIKSRSFPLYNCTHIIMSGPVNLKHVPAVCNFSPDPLHWGQSSLQSLFVLFFMLKTKTRSCFGPWPALTLRNHRMGCGSPAKSCGGTKGMDPGGF